MIDLLKPEPGSSFSDLWYRVGPTRPRLASHAQTIRQRFGGRTMHVVEDPAGGQYYRLSEPAYFFLGLLDGRTTVHQAWDACNAQLGDEAPTQRECVEVLSKLQMFGLLSGEDPLAPDVVALRRRNALMQVVKQRTGFGLSVTIPLINPERFLEATAWLWRGVFSPLGLAAWCLVVLVGLYHALANAPDLARGVNQIINPENLLWLGVVFLLLRGWHELGHAAACKALGARCTEVGVMLMLLVLPFPYCDASSSWRLPSPTKRIVVAAAGMLFELFAAAIAAVVWAYAEPGTIKTICYNAMILSGVTTLVFNLNPLLRYDGYYILSDLTGIANLWQRSREALLYVVERLMLGVRGVRPPAVRGPREFWFLVAYAVLSFPYRVFVTASIVIFIWSNPAYLTLGTALAAFAIVMFVLFPLGKGVTYLLTSPKLIGRRSRAWGATLAAIALVAIVVGLIPVSAGVEAPAILRAAEEEPVRPGESGYVSIVHAHAGQRLEKGEPILTLENQELLAQLASARARLEQAKALLDQAAVDSPTRREVAERTLAQAQGDLDRASARVESLVVRAPVSGVLASTGSAGLRFDALEGRFLTKGTLLGVVGTTDRMMVRALVSDRDHAYAFSGVEPPRRGTVRVRGQASRDVPATIVRVASAGSRRVQIDSLTAPAGGEIDLDPASTERQVALVPRYEVDLEPLVREGDEPLHSGRRARVRFELPKRPLAWQWWRRVSQMFSEQSATR